MKERFLKIQKKRGMSNEEIEVQSGSADLHRSGAGYRRGPAVR